MNAAPIRPLKVLLVEDSEALAQRLSEAIGHISGIHLIGVTDTEAVAIATASKDVDVIVLDLHLKQGTGFGVMRALAAAPRRPTIIVLTNYDLPEYKKAAAALGATHFLDKAHSERLVDLLAEIQKHHAEPH